MSPNSIRRTLAAAAAILILATLTGCQPDNIFFSVGNVSGGTLHDVKVAYPGGLLNLGTLEPSSFTGTYRHFNGPGDLSVSYATESGRTYSHSGPHVAGNETGGVKVNIDGSDATFETNFDAVQK
jgi:hypothetical protein